MAEKAIGVYYNDPHEKAPKFIKGSISIKYDSLNSLIEQITKNKNSKWYTKLNIHENTNRETGEMFYTVNVDNYDTLPKDFKKVEWEKQATIEIEDIPF